MFLDSISMDNNNEFTLVTSKKKRVNKQKSNFLSKTGNILSDKFNLTDALDLEKKIIDCKSKLKNYDQYFYWEKVKIEMRQFLINYFKVSILNEINLISYGLGSMDENLCSRYQLALLLLLIDEIRSFNNITLNTPEFYDPVFNSIDKYLLTQSFGLKVLEKNDQCFRSVIASNSTKKILTIFYMPHCGKALFNNLLYSNWTTPQLSSLAIFGIIYDFNIYFLIFNILKFKNCN